MSDYYLELLTGTTYNIKDDKGAIINAAPLFKDEAIKELAKLKGVKTPKKQATKPKKEKKAKKEEKNDEQEERDMDD